ncbi:MAG: Ig-like domain-containing protein [Desulfotignum sp.]|nr:Ig-like domain-containing protein [Desulfotignum sp.]
MIFTYTATDNDGGVSDAHAVTITVTGITGTNQLPVASDDTQTTEENTVLKRSPGSDRRGRDNRKLPAG